MLDCIFLLVENDLTLRTIVRTRFRVIMLLQRAVCWSFTYRTFFVLILFIIMKSFVSGTSAFYGLCVTAVSSSRIFFLLWLHISSYIFETFLFQDKSAKCNTLLDHLFFKSFKLFRLFIIITLKPKPNIMKFNKKEELLYNPSHSQNQHYYYHFFKRK